MADRIVLNTISYHGHGAIENIVPELTARGYKKAFVCSDPDLIKFGVTGKITALLDAASFPYAVYSARGTMNPFLAEQTGFSEQDWQTLVEAMVHLFDFDASAARPAGAMAVRKLVLFKHNSQLGNAPAHKLMDAVSITRKADVEVARSFKDYEVTIDQSAIPAGVTVEVIEN